MAYTKHTWECDELITADKLNNIEDGIEEAVGEGTNIDYLTLEWQYDSDIGRAIADGKGTFCGYNYYATVSLVPDTDTDSRWMAVGEIAYNPEDPNALPSELCDAVRLLVLNRLWGLFGGHPNGSVYYDEYKFEIARSTYNMFEEFDKTFTISL